MSINRLIDSPLSWAIAGFFIGLALGVSSASMWMVAIGLGGFLLYLRLHGPADPAKEGLLFAAGPVFIASWLTGFVVQGLAF